MEIGANRKEDIMTKNRFCEMISKDLTIKAKYCPHHIPTIPIISSMYGFEVSDVLLDLLYEKPFHTHTIYANDIFMLNDIFTIEFENFLMDASKESKLKNQHTYVVYFDASRGIETQILMMFLSIATTFPLYMPTNIRFIMYINDALLIEECISHKLPIPTDSIIIYHNIFIKY